MTLRRLLAVVLLSAAACVLPPATSASAETFRDPSVPKDAVPVGRIVIEATDPARANRPVTFDVWYPATTATTEDDYIDLEYTEIQSWAYRGAPFQTGPFPLVLFSHATYADRFQSFDQLYALASYGFVVAAPTHEGHTLANEVRGTTVSFAQSIEDRRADMALVKKILDGDQNGPGLLTSILAHDATGDPRLGVMGHSVGAVTALQLSDGAYADPDVDAVVAVGPALMFHTPDTGDETPDEDPLLIVGGSADVVTPPAYSQQLWDSWDSTRKFRTELADVNHAAPSSGCAILDALALALWNDPGNTELAEAVQVLSDRMDGACDPPHPEPWPVNRTVTGFVVPFLGRQLQGEQGFETWLSRARSNRPAHLPNDYWRCTAPAGPCDTAPS